MNSTTSDGICPGKNKTREVKPWQPDYILQNTYRIESFLGQGGMGTVYLVRRIRDNHPFAVKTMIASTLDDPFLKRDFLRELRTWIDLPEHPNLTACRFFRTLEDRMAIFAEYVPGGSLTSWIRSGKLNDPIQILDVAIQICRGIHIAHEYGIVHQDIKPANVLMALDGTAKITDFGLARARGLPRTPHPLLATDQSLMVSSAGMTPMYASPEQFERRPVSRRSDIWSIGLTILEIFLGAPTWKFGLVAPEILQTVVTNGTGSGRPRIPQVLTEFLARCFKPDPSDRWPTLEEPIRILIQTFEEVAGYPYPRPQPDAIDKPVGILMKPERRTDIGRRWMDPDRILERAYELTGRDPGSASVVIPDRSGSSRSQALADLEVYEEVDEIYSALVDGGWEEIRMEMARVLQDKSLLLYYLEDVQAAVREIDRVIGLLAGFSESECEPEIGRCLSDMYTQKAVFLWKTGHAEQTIPLYDQALKYQEQVIRSADSIETRSALATILLNKGNALVTSGRLSEGIDIYDRCLKIRESLELNDPVRKLNDIAVVLMNKAISLSRSHRNPEAWECDQRVIRIREKLAASRDSQAKYDLAMAYSNASVNLLEMKQNEISLEFNRKALSLIEELVHRQGRNDLIDELIRTKLNLAVSLADSGQTDPALLTVDDAIRQREDQIVNKGRDDQRVHLGKLFYAKAGFLFDKNRYQKALEQYMLALKVWEDLATAGKDMTSRMNLPKTCFGISQCLYYSGDVPSAIEYASRAVDLAAELTQGNQICQLNYPQGVFLAWQSVLNTATGNPSDPEPIHRKFINHLKFLSLTSDPSGEVPQDYDNGRSAKDNVLCALKFFRDLMKGHRIIQFSHLIDEMEKLLTGENIN